MRAALSLSKGSAHHETRFSAGSDLHALAGEDAAQMAGGQRTRGREQAVALKPYPSCFLTHAVIDGVLAARRDLDLHDESAVTR